MIRLVIFFISVFLFIAACKNKSESKDSVERSTSDSVKPVDPKTDSLQQVKATQDSIQSALRRDSILLRLTQTILSTIKNKNYSSFANYIDPVSGIRFSPYGYVDTVNNVILTRRKFNEQVAKQDRMVWGEFDGVGEKIEMTLNNYIQRFVYDVDFVKPEKRSVDEFLGSGNSLNNLLSVYKDCHFTESYFSGFDEKYKGMDWRSLRLVFKERNKRYFLVGIVHDEWTI